MHPILREIKGIEPDYPLSDLDLKIFSLTCKVYNYALQNSGFPFRCGEKGIILNRFEDSGPLNFAVKSVLVLIDRIWTTHGGIIIVEHPEAGMHPSWQCLLGELLFLASTNQLWTEAQRQTLLEDLCRISQSP